MTDSGTDSIRSIMEGQLTYLEFFLKLLRISYAYVHKAIMGPQNLNLTHLAFVTPTYI